MHLTKINGPSSPFPPSLETITFSTGPVEWKSRHAPIEFNRNGQTVQKADLKEPVGDPSPLSSPLGPLSESPESESSSFQKLSLHADQPLRGSVDSLSSGYDPLPRSAITALSLTSPPGLGLVNKLTGSSISADPHYSRVIMDSVYLGWTAFASNHRAF
jgi:hypothetical protein